MHGSRDVDWLSDVDHAPMMVSTQFLNACFRRAWANIMCVVKGVIIALLRNPFVYNTQDSCLAHCPAHIHISVHILCTGQRGLYQGSECPA